MARRFRRKSRSQRYRRRRYRRRGSRLGRIVASISRKMAGEVKKADNNALVTQNAFTQFSPQQITGVDTAASQADFGFLYPVFGNTSYAQGLNLDDFIGEQIRAKYLYFGLHLQQPNGSAIVADNSISNGALPITLRCMLIQDRNYNNFGLSTSATTGSQINGVSTMFYNIFGIDLNTASANQNNTYLNNMDVTLLPINPHEPGRFNVIRDFRMTCAPGWRTDYYKKLMILQKDLNSKGRIYFGNEVIPDNSTAPPGEQQSVRTVSRNNLYLLFLWQQPIAGDTINNFRPIFNLSVQTRFAYYDN